MTNIPATLADRLADALAEYMACVGIATNPAMGQADVLTIAELHERMTKARDNAEAILETYNLAKVSA